MKIRILRSLLRTASMISLFAALTSPFALLANHATEYDSASNLDIGQELQIDDAFLRINPNGKNAAAYMTISNKSTKDMIITDVSVDESLATKTEMHETITEIEEGIEVKKMKPVEKFIIPALGKLELKCGSSHIMLLDLKDKQIDSVMLTLKFQDGMSKNVQLMVKNKKVQNS